MTKFVDRILSLLNPAVSFVLWIYLYLVSLLGLWVLLGMFFGGWSPLVVTSGSMEPTLSVGDVLLVEEDFDEALAQRAVVVFDNDSDTTIVHRVFAIEGDSLATKGDANPTPDAQRVQTSDIDGVGRLVVPLIGLPAVWIAEGSFVAVAGWMIVSVAALSQFFQAMIQRSRRRSEVLASSLPVVRQGVQRVRFLVAVLILVQFLLDPTRFDVLGSDAGRVWLLVAAQSVLLGTNAIGYLATDLVGRRGFALAELAADTALVVTLSTLTGSSGIGWVLFALPIIEAAVRFRLVGALTHWILLTGVTLGAHIWTSEFRSSSLLLEDLEQLLDQLSVLFLVVVPGAYLVEQLIGDVKAQQDATGEAQHRTALLHSVAEAGHRVVRLGGEHLDAIIDGTRELGFDRVDVVMCSEGRWRVIGGDDGYLPEPGRAGSGLLPEDPANSVVTTDEATKNELKALKGKDLSALVSQTMSDRDGHRVVLRAGIAAENHLGTDQAEAFQLFARQASIALQNDELLLALTSVHDELHHQARHDALTGLPNRSMLLHRLSEVMADELSTATTDAATDAATDATTTDAGSDARRTQVGLLFLDLNGFKPVNDRLGHEVGDDLLRLVARRLRALEPENGLVCRIGGDEFTVLIEDLDSEQSAIDLAQQITGIISQPFSLADELVSVAVSVGIAFVEPGMSAAELVRRADVAMYHAKRRSDLDHACFDVSLDDEERRRARLSNDLVRALQHDELHLEYQPIYRVGDAATIVGSEALVRWQHPELGPIPPGEIIDLARASQKVEELNSWIVGRACRDTSTLLEFFPGLPYFVTVNASPEELASGALVHHVSHSLETTGLSSARLMIEISERLVAIDDPVVNRSMNNLRQAGIGLLLDDFGEGHTSISYLNELPVTGIKLDRRLVVNTLRSDTDRIILESIIDLCRRLELAVIAEGVESEAQLRTVAGAGTNLIQGYLLARPMRFERLCGVMSDVVHSRQSEIVASGSGGR